MPQQALTFGIEENLTIVLGYKRDWGSDGLPAPDTGALGLLNRILPLGDRAARDRGHHGREDRLLARQVLRRGRLVPRQLAGDGRPLRLDAADRLGPLVVPAARPERREGEVPDRGDRLAAGQLPHRGRRAARRRRHHHLQLLAHHLRARPARRDGASYLSFSGGIGIEAPSGLKVAVTVKGLRFRVAGNPDAPGTKLDGFFLYASGPAFVGEGGGYYRELVGRRQGSELGFSVTLTLDFAKRSSSASTASSAMPSAERPFDYFMFQAFYVGTIGPLATFELTGAQLCTREHAAALRDVDREARELALDLKWVARTRPADRARRTGGGELAADKGSWPRPGGVGVAAGARQGRRAHRLRAAVRGPAEKGLLVVAEVFALGRTRPFGYAAIEIDRHNDRISFMLGVDVRLSTFVKEAPAWMDSSAR